VLAPFEPSHQPLSHRLASFAEFLVAHLLKASAGVIPQKLVFKVVDASQRDAAAIVTPLANGEKKD